MATNEAKKTKQTLQANQQKFKQLQTQTDNLGEEVRRQLFMEIDAIDKNEARKIKIENQKRKKLALKSTVNPYVTENLRDQEQIPVDGDLRAGTMVFMKNCSTCHSLEVMDGTEKRGPPLGLIFNRRAGSHTLFSFYSTELLAASFHWTARNLYCFMGNPTSLFKNSTCRLQKSPLVSEEDRADLITLFREFTNEMSFNVRLKEIQRKGYDYYQTQLHATREQQIRGLMRQKSDANREKKV